MTERLLQARFDGARLWRIVSNETFDDQQAKLWINDHFHITIQASILYVIVVFGTKWFMRNREPFSLTLPLNIWNLFLAVFSTVGTYKLTREFAGTISEKGLRSSYCYIDQFTEGENGFWVFVFILSKVIELIDTLFLVLRKRPLMFLHWYHHILTGVYAFFSYPHSPGFNRWGIYLNFFVHMFMYSYYFLRSAKIWVPGVVAKFITSIQILQFAISVGILVHLGILIFIQNVPCDFDTNVFYLAMFMDVTYLALFINFFLKSYVLGGGKAKYQSKPKAKKN